MKVQLNCDAIRKKRVLLNITQEELSRRVGCSLRSISTFENRKTSVSLKTAHLLANAICVELEEIITSDEKISDLPHFSNYARIWGENDKYLIDEYLILALERIVDSFYFEDFGNYLRDQKFKIVDSMILLEYLQIEFSLLENSYDTPNSDMIYNWIIQLPDVQEEIYSEVSSLNSNETRAVPLDTDDYFTAIDNTNYFSFESEIPDNQEELEIIQSLLSPLKKYAVLQKDVYADDSLNLYDGYTEQLKIKMDFKNNFKKTKERNSKISVLGCSIIKSSGKLHNGDLLNEEWAWFKVFVVHKNSPNYLTENYYRGKLDLDPKNFILVNETPQKSVVVDVYNKIK